MDTITIISAFPIAADVAKKIEKTFRAKHETTVEFAYELDSKLLGGLLVIDGENYYDATIKGQLSSIKKTLE